jgi:hypothetical protein
MRWIAGLSPAEPIQIEEVLFFLTESSGETAGRLSAWSLAGLGVGGSLRCSSYGNEGREEEVDAIEGSVAENSVISLGGGVVKAVEAGDVCLKYFDGKTGVLKQGQGVDVVVLVAETSTLSLNAESSEAGEVGRGGAGSDNAHVFVADDLVVVAVVGIAGGDGSDRASSHMKGKVGDGAEFLAPRLGSGLEEWPWKKDTVAAAGAPNAASGGGAIEDVRSERIGVCLFADVG